MAKADKLTDLQIATILEAGIGQSVGFAESKLAKEREKVQQAYDGLTPKRAHHGDSAYISHDVYEGVESMKAQLVDTFSANNRPVSFVPVKGEDVVGAKVRTDYCTDVIFNQNPGYKITNQVIHQGLTERNGIVKIWWEPRKKTEYFHLSDVTFDELSGYLAQYPDADVTEAVEDGAGGFKRVTVKLTKDVSQTRIMVLAPEEFGISPMAKDIETADLVWDRQEMTHSELLKAGYPKEKVDQLQDNDKIWLSLDNERMTRFQETDDIIGTSAVNDDGQKSKRVCVVYECYTELDIEGTGEAQLYKVTKVGNTILDKEPVDRKPYIDFCPLPRPNAFWGHNYGLKLLSTQVARTYLMRGIINHTLTTNNPRLQVVKGSVLNPKELMENRFGGIVNVTRPDGIAPLPQAPLNSFVFSTIEMLKATKEEMTGISQLSQGLNKDAISKQNSGDMVHELITVSQVRQKIVARNFAEFYRKLYTEVHRLTVENEDRQKVINVAGAWQPVDFTQWPEDAEMEVSFALGYGEQAKEAAKLATLGTALAQDPALSQWFTPKQHHYIAHKVLEISGYKDVDQMLAPFDQPTPPPPDPMQQAEIAMKQADAKVKEANAQAALASIELQKQEAAQKHAIEMAKINLETLKVQAELQLKQDMLAHKVAVDAAELTLEQQIAKNDAAKQSISAVAAPTR